MIKLAKWIHSKINKTSQPLTREAIDAYQLVKLREIIDFCREKSPFYCRHLKGFSGKQIATLEDLSDFPFTTSQDIRDNSLQFLCVSQDEIQRVVTLQTSGTTGNPKRLYFTRQDLELSIDFFAHAMSDFVHAGEKVLILLPGEKPNSVGDLIAKGLERIQVKGLIHGPVRDPARTAEEIKSQQPACLIGIPTQVLRLARTQHIPRGIIRNVILTTDYVPIAIVSALEKIWGCQVFNHYGMTEMGLGGGVECGVGYGVRGSRFGVRGEKMSLSPHLLPLPPLHLREADLHVEVIDPDTGEAKPDGELAEIVFTTLTRNGMPLIRYRTGDIARFLPEPCHCGTVLKRLERVQGRLDNRGQIGADILSMADLDEALFPIPNLLDFQAVMTEESALQIFLYVKNNSPDSQTLTQVQDALRRIPSLSNMTSAGLEIRIDFSKTNRHNTGAEKRVIRKGHSEAPF
jgi:phenylacetate-coenzyme A ligase PaaK-like adenylate-forming protein